MALEDLIAKAKKLKIEFDEENITEEELKAMIDVAEAQNKVDDNKNKSSNKDAEYLESELQKAITKRDEIKKERRKLLADKKALEDQLKNMPDADEIKSLREELDTLKAFKEEIDLAKEADERKKMDKISRMEKDHEDELKAKEDEVKAEKERLAALREEEEKEKKSLLAQVKDLRVARLEAEIVKVAATLNAWSPDQVARLVKNDFVYDDDLGRFVYTVRDSKGKIKEEKEVDEYVTDYLKKEENENLIKSNVNTDSLHSDKDDIDKRGIGSDKDKNKESKSYNPKDPEIIEAAEMENMEPQRYIDKVLIPMDKALNRGTDNEE